MPSWTKKLRFAAKPKERARLLTPQETPTPILDGDSLGQRSSCDVDKARDVIAFTKRSAVLWDRAYERLKEEDSKTVDAYEKILAHQLNSNKSMVGSLKDLENVTPTEALQKWEELRKMVNEGLDRTERTATIKDNVQKAASLLTGLKSNVDSAVSASPEASAAWAGVCFALSVLMNPLAESSSNRAGIYAVFGMWDWYFEVLPIILETRSSDKRVSKLREALEDSAINFLVVLLRYQMKTVSYQFRNKFVAFAGDLIQLEDWNGKYDAIQKAERDVQACYDVYLRLVDNSNLADVETNTRKHLDQSIKAEDRKLLQTLKSCNYEAFKDRNPQRAPRTCSWVRRHDIYHQWNESQQSSLLWVSADPGCGKSVLSKAFVDEPKFSSLPSSRVVCYFFFKDNDEQSKFDVALCAILHQIFSQRPDLLPLARNSWDRHGNKISSDTDELWRIFCDVVTSAETGSILCVLDALDECRSVDRSRLLAKLKILHKTEMCPPNARQTVCKMVVTSRPHEDLEQSLDGLPEIRLRGEDENESLREEIDSVVKARVRDLAKDLRMSEANMHKLERRLLEMQHRTYLWLYLALESIRERFRRSLRHDQVEIDGVPSTVQEAYEKMLLPVKQSANEDARRALAIIVGARRPLFVSELRYALGIAHNVSPKSLDDTALDIDVKAWIRDNCHLFVYFNSEKAYLIHQTAKEFLVQNSKLPVNNVWSQSFTVAEVDQLMASICIKTLLTDDFTRKYMNMQRDRPVRVRREIEQWKIADLWLENGRNGKYTWILYSAISWTGHARDNFEDLEAAHGAQIDHLHDFQAEKASLWTLILWEYSDHLRRYNFPSTRLALCAFTNYMAGFSKAVKQSHKELLESAQEVSYMAGLAGNVHVIRQLFDEGLDNKVSTQGANDYDKNHSTFLEIASENGHIQAIKIFLDLSAAHKDKTVEFGSALSRAARRGHVDVMRLLLDWGADINACNDSHRTALAEAAATGRNNLVLELLSRGANINHGEECPLQAAVCSRATHTIRLLLENGADINAVDAVKATVLFSAVLRQDMTSVLVLLEWSPNLELQCSGFSPLCFAAFFGSVDMVKVLLNNGADPNAVSIRRETALQVAARRSDGLDIVQALLEKGADPNARGPAATALQRAAKNDNLDVLRLLLQSGAHVNALGKDGLGTALEEAALEGNIDIVRELLECGADSHIRSDCYGKIAVGKISITLGYCNVVYGVSNGRTCTELNLSTEDLCH